MQDRNGNGGVTPQEFVALMRPHLPEAHQHRRIPLAETRGYLTECVSRGLMSVHVGDDGMTRYRPTGLLSQMFEDIE